MRRAVRLAALFAALATPALAQDQPSQDSEILFNNVCRTCHVVKEGDNRLGPSLAGVIGRKAGTLPGYAFTDALKNSNVTWDDATLDKFIENPDSLVTGHNMKPYAGLPDAADRAKIIAHLKAAGG